MGKGWKVLSPSGTFSHAQRLKSSLRSVPLTEMTGENPLTPLMCVIGAKGFLSGLELLQPCL